MAQINQKQTYYRLSDKECSTVTIYPSEKTTNDYSTLAECELNIDDIDDPIVENLMELIFGGIVVLLLIILLIVWLIKRK